MEIFRCILGCVTLLCIVNGQQQFETTSFTSQFIFSDEATGQSSSRGNYVTTTTTFDLQPSSTTTIVNQSLQSKLISYTSSTVASEQSELTTNNGPASVEGPTSDNLLQYSSTPAQGNTYLNIISSLDGPSYISSTVETTVDIAPSRSIQASESPDFEAKVQTTEALLEGVSSSADASRTAVASSSYVPGVVITSITDEQANVIQASSASEQFTSSFDSVHPSNDISSDSPTSSVLKVDSRRPELDESSTLSAHFEISSASLDIFPSSIFQEIIDASSSSVQEIIDASSSSVQEIIDASSSSVQELLEASSSSVPEIIVSSSSVQEIIDASSSSVQELLEASSSSVPEIIVASSSVPEIIVASSSDQNIIVSSTESTEEYRPDVSSSISYINSDDIELLGTSTALALEPSSDVYFSTRILDTFTQETSITGGPQEAFSSAQSILRTSREDSVSSDAFQPATPSISQATYQTQIPANLISSSMQKLDLVSESSSVVLTAVQSSSVSSEALTDQTSVLVTRENTEVLTSQSEEIIVSESTYSIESSAQSKDLSGQTVFAYSSLSASDYLSSEIIDTYPSLPPIASMVTSDVVQSDMLTSTSISDIFIPDSASEMSSSIVYPQGSSETYSTIPLDSFTSSTEQTAFSESSAYSDPLSSVGPELIISNEVSSTWFPSSELMPESVTSSTLPEQVSVDQTESVPGRTESQASLGIYLTESPLESFLIQSTSVLSMSSESTALNPSEFFQPSYSESVISSQEESASFEAYETDTIFTYTLSVTGSTSSRLSDSSFRSSDYVFGSEIFSTGSTEGTASVTPDLDSNSYQPSVQESISFRIKESSEVTRSLDIYQSVSSVMYESMYTEIESSSTSFPLESTSLRSGSSLPIYGSETALSDSFKFHSDTFLSTESSSEMSGSLTIETVLYPASTAVTILSSELISDSFKSETSTAIVLPSEQPVSTSVFMPTDIESILDSSVGISVSDALLPGFSSTSDSASLDSSLSSYEDSLLVTIDSSIYGPTYPSETESGIQSSSLDLSAPSSAFYDMSSDVYGSSSTPTVNSSVVDITFPSLNTFSQTLMSTDSVVVSLSSSLVIYPNSSSGDIYIPTESSTDYSDIFVSETMTLMPSLDSESSELIIPRPTSLSFERSISVPEFDRLKSSISEPMTVASVSTTSPEGSSFYPMPSFGIIESSFTVTEHTSYASFYPQTSGGDVSSMDFTDVTSLIYPSQSDSEVQVLPSFDLTSLDLRSTSSAFGSFESMTFQDSQITDMSSLPEMTSLQVSETRVIFESLSSFEPLESTEVISSSEINLPSFVPSGTVSSLDVSISMPSFVSGSMSSEVSDIVPIFPSLDEFSSSSDVSFIVPSFSISESLSQVTDSIPSLNFSETLSTDFVSSDTSISYSLSTDTTDVVSSFASTESFKSESSTYIPSFELSSASITEISDIVPSFEFSSQSMSTEITDLFSTESFITESLTFVPSFEFSSGFTSMSTEITDIVPSLAFSSESMSTEITDIVPSSALASESIYTEITDVPSFGFSTESLSTEITDLPTSAFASEVMSTAISDIVPSFAFSSEFMSTDLVPSFSSSESLMSESSTFVPSFEFSSGFMSTEITGVVPSFAYSSESMSTEITDFVPSFPSTELLFIESSTFVPTFELSSEILSTEILENETLSTGISNILSSFTLSSEIQSTGISFAPTFSSYELNSTELSSFLPSFGSVFVPSIDTSDSISSDLSNFVPSLTTSEYFQTVLLSTVLTESVYSEISVIVPSFPTSMDISSETNIIEPSLSSEQMTTTGVPTMSFSTESFVSSEIMSINLPSIPLQTESMASSEISITQSAVDSTSSIVETMSLLPESMASSRISLTKSEYTTSSVETMTLLPESIAASEISVYQSTADTSSLIVETMTSLPESVASSEISVKQSEYTTSSIVEIITPSYESMASSEISVYQSAVDTTSSIGETMTSLPESISSTEISVYQSAVDTTSSIGETMTSLPESISSTEISVYQSTADTTSSIVDTVTPLPETSSLESSFLSPTPTEAPMSSEVSSLMTSSVLPTMTPTQPPSTTPTINTGDENFWVITVIKVRRSEDVTTDSFKNNIQTKLASVYQEAFIREALIKNGTYEPLKRRKRYATSPDGTIKTEVLSIERQSGSSNTDITYLAEKDGALVPADKMVDTLGLLDDQEVALGLGYVVSTKAEPHLPVPVTPPVEDRKLWIIAAVLGPLALLLVIWIVVCLCCKFCCVRKGARDAEEPHLMKVRRDGAQVENQFESSENPPDYPPEGGGQRSNGVGLVKSSTKKMSYEVNPDPDDESPLYAEVKKPVEAGRIPKKKHPSPSHKSGAADQVVYVSEDDNTTKRKPRKKKQTQKDADDSSSQIENMVEPYHHEPRSKPLPVPRAVKPHRDEPISHEDEEELMERAEIERLKNKQRLREQRKKEKLNNSGSTRGEGGYRKAQREIDAVLGAPEQEENLPDVFVNKPKKRSTRWKKDQEGHNNEAYMEDEQEASSTTGESLEEAKQRMHRLLDDAFSLISSSRSSIGNKVTPMESPKKKDSRSRPTSHRSDESDRSHRSHKSDRRESTESKPQEEDKKHTPMFYNPTYSGHEEGGLETWSPYRAADEVALISLPQTQTVMDKTPTQERLQTTTFNESYPTSMRDSYYTTEPAKPIVIRTKDMDTQDMTSSFKPAPKHQTVNGIGGMSGNLPNGDASYPGMKGYEEIPLHSVTNKHNHSGHRENGEVPHQAPIKTWAGQDEVDIVSSLETGSSPRPFIRSLREELEHLSTKVGDYPEGTDSKGNT